MKREERGVRRKERGERGERREERGEWRKERGERREERGERREERGDRRSEIHVSMCAPHGDAVFRCECVVPGLGLACVLMRRSASR